MSTSVEARGARPPSYAGEQSRAVYPTSTGVVDRDGVRTHYEVYGYGEATVVLVPTWAIVHSRAWKAQIGHLSRYYRVVTFDPRGNGRSDRPQGRPHYSEREYAEDTLAVMDATDTRRAVLMGNSTGVQRALLVAAEHPDRVAGLVGIGPYFVGTRSFEVMLGLARSTYDRRPLTTTGKLKFNGRYIADNAEQFVAWFARQVYNVPHSTKQIEDFRRWAAETDGSTIADTWIAEKATAMTRRAQLELARRVHCPALIVCSLDDVVTPPADAKVLAEALGADVLEVAEGGHTPHARKPALVNRRLLEFCRRVLGPGHPQPRGARTSDGRPRALFVSSPIGLGHARRDLGIARALRERVPDLDVEWFTQHPVTTMLELEGERVHPASTQLALESGHIESESGEHDLHCFQAFRRMDEILVHNFMVFRDVVDDGRYDLVVGDESWDIDYFTHEHPRMKRTSYAWLTDFVGWLPMPDGGREEEILTADYNAEMIGHIERHPGVRDRAIYVGSEDDLVPGTFGPDLPPIRDWVRNHYDFAGYVLGYDPRGLGERAALRAELGYRDDERVCIAAVGGSGVGAPLLRRVIEAHRLARRQMSDLRTVVVAGPRIELTDVPGAPGLEVTGYVHGLHRHLAACDLAVVQGGLTTTMELVAGGVPFLYFPLQHHFEQQYWVRHRLDRYRAGRAMSYADSDPDAIAAAMIAEIGRPTDYLPVEHDGADRAAALIAEIL